MAEVETAGLGDSVKDVISGFTGIVTEREQHMHGCDRLVVSPTSITPEGALKESYVFDAQRLEVIAKGVIACLPVSEADSRFTLGAEAQDEVTGFKGIVSVISTTIYGLVAISIDPGKLSKDQVPESSQVFHATRVKLVEAKPVPIAEGHKTTRPGGPIEARRPERRK
jgi:hypothetical protein